MTRYDLFTGSTQILKEVLTLSGGTITWNSATFTLYDKSRNVVVGPVSVTGYSVASGNLTVWYGLSTATLNVGNYIGEFDINASYSDSQVRLPVILVDLYLHGRS